MVGEAFQQKARFCISVRSTVGEGITFTVLLPMVR
jgi:hypothetical protein